MYCGMCNLVRNEWSGGICMAGELGVGMKYVSDIVPRDGCQGDSFRQRLQTDVRLLEILSSSCLERGSADDKKTPEAVLL